MIRLNQLPPAVHTLLEGLSAEDAALLGRRVTEETDGDADAAAAAAWLMGANAALNVALGRHICRVCGCWQDNACPQGCAWAEPNLCTACAAPEGTSTNREPPEPCSKCGAVTDPMLFCDEVLTETFCGACWPATPCARGEHGEECSTAMFHGQGTMS